MVIDDLDIKGITAFEMHRKHIVYDRKVKLIAVDGVTSRDERDGGKVSPKCEMQKRQCSVLSAECRVLSAACCVLHAKCRKAVLGAKERCALRNAVAGHNQFSVTALVGCGLSC